MRQKLYHRLSIACKAAVVAYSRASKKGESLQEILGYTDALTGIPNRRAFEEDRKNISSFQTFILVDVDNLKQLNDTFGHLFGDKILIACARILNNATENVGKAYRLSGDEFALIIPKCWVKNVCLYIGYKVKEDSRFTISMGIAPPCGAAGLTEDIFKAAEMALYQCKHRESNIYAEFLGDDLDNTIPAGKVLVDDLCAAE